MSTADLFDNAPCGYLTADANRRILTVNRTLASWVGHPRDALVGRPFTDLLAAGSRIHYETHFGPILQVHGEFSGVTVDLIAADRTCIPVFVAANTETDANGRIELLRIVFQDASD
ncbi:MAG TPA: PAS domain-containing protein, partial [Mycobacterium sp.]|nr:PAS domain-containing protein [Mycobacterium sp.]